MHVLLIGPLYLGFHNSIPCKVYVSKSGGGGGGGGGNGLNSACISF